eukprot:7158722-Alexandrium_andersonii.AAC.1
MTGGEGFLAKLDTGFQSLAFSPSAIHLALSALADLVISLREEATASSSPVSLCSARDSIKLMVAGEIHGFFGFRG